MSYTIQNPQLEFQITQYIDQVDLDIPERVLTLVLEKVKDEHIVYVYYETAAFSFTRRLPHAYTIVADEYVLISYSVKPLFALDHAVLWQILKNHFPSQHEYFERYNEFPPPITGSVPTWKLTFQGDELQKVEEDIIFPFL